MRNSECGTVDRLLTPNICPRSNSCNRNYRNIFYTKYPHVENLGISCFEYCTYPHGQCTCLTHTIYPSRVILLAAIILTLMNRRCGTYNISIKSDIIGRHSTKEPRVRT